MTELSHPEACRILGVPPSASNVEIKARYLFLIQMLHPDRNLDKPEKVRLQAQDEFIRVKEAYEYLTGAGSAYAPEAAASPPEPTPLPPALLAIPRLVRVNDLALNQRKSVTLEVRSTGGPYTNFWVDNAPASWLRVTDIRSKGAEPLPLLVTLEAAGLRELEREQTCSLQMRLVNELTGRKAELSVEVTATAKIAVPRLRPGSNSLAFRNIPPGARSQDILEIANAGHSALQGRITTDSPWLSVSPDKIRLRGSSAAPFTVRVDTAGLGYDFSATGYVSIISNGGNAAVPVELSTARKSHPPKKGGGCVLFLVLLLLVLIAIIVIWLTLNTQQCAAPQLNLFIT
jgi:hypothetical protein